MKRYVWILIVSMWSSTMYAQSYEWDEVAAFEQQSLPQSALKVVNGIYDRALAKGDSPDFIQALVYKLKYEGAIDQDRLSDKITELEAFVQTDENKVQQAFLYSLLAELYANYYQANSSAINQRTALFDFTPEDMREWAGNVFIQKVADNVRLSLLPATELQKTKALDYRAVLNEGESSINLRPSLYDFLVHRGIELLSNLASNYQTQNYFPQTKLSGKQNFAPAKTFVTVSVVANEQDFVPQILKLYQQLLTFRLSENNPEALLMADLDRLDFVYRHTQSDSPGDDYIQALEQLEGQYKANDFCVEILYKKANYYYTNSLESGWLEIESRDSFRNNIDNNRGKVYEICNDGIDRYPQSKRIGLLRNLLSTITQGDLNVQSPNGVYPGKDLELTIKYRNLSKVSIEIYKINAAASVYPNDWSRQGQYNKTGTLVEKKEVNLVNDYPYLYSDTVIRIPMQELGNYEYVIHAGAAKEEPANRQFSVSRLSTLARGGDNQREFLVVDRLTGKPIERAKINFYKGRGANLYLDKSIATDKLGLTRCDADKDVAFYNASFGNDTALILSSVPWVSTYQRNENAQQELSLFTDRSIYRPGQTVYFKGIASKLGKEVREVLPNKSYSISLKDANYKEIAQKTFTTNEFGSISGEFVLPHGLMNGSFRIESNEDRGYASIRVEEYKRPTFDIQFQKNDKTYNLGDEVTVEGNAKTFSGINLQAATVQYRVTRQDHWLFSRMWRRNPVQIADGSVQTKEDGSFNISFLAEKAFADKDRKNVFYTYTIEATVTDTNGETQQSQTFLSIGDKSMYLSVSGLSEVVSKESVPTVRINAANLSGNPVEAKGTVEVYSLVAKDKSKLDLKSDEWKQEKLVYSGSFESGKESAVISDLVKKSLSSGRYRIVAKAKDDKGREIETQQDFTLASEKDKRPPVAVSEWLMTPKTTCEVGEKAEIIYGSSAKDVYVLYELFQNDKKLSASRFTLNNENRKIEIPFLDSYGDGVIASLTFIKEGKVYSRNITIRRKQPDRGLTVKTEVFRDRLIPGQQEEWKLSVKDSDGKPAIAELLAGMYDASLDKIREHFWYFNPVRDIYLSAPLLSSGNELRKSESYFFPDQETYIEVPSFDFDSFNWFGFSLYNNRIHIRGVSTADSGGQMLRSQGAENKVRESNALMDENGGDIPPPIFRETIAFTPPVVVADDDSELLLTQQEAALEESEVLQIRQNFNETAFFYPQLKTNEAGETLLSFIVPESNTTWKLMGLAHTKDLKFGEIVKEAISQKQLMVTPNIPRFMREGDRMTLSSNISNFTESTITGTVSLECFDPNTNKPIITIAEASKPFSVEAGRTNSVSWVFEVPSGIDMIAVKIVAQSAEFSDGEQHLIPVLPNRMMVTESLPLSILGGQTKTVTFDKLKNNTSSTLSDYRLSLEFTSNPTWYAVQALPGITAPQSENVLSWFAAYYSNTLATHIAQSTPKIKQMINVWTKQGGTKETLLSNLEKNQELKAVLLEETPWVLEAGNETEQKQRLSLLFDLNRTQNLNATAIEKLQSLQKEDGGWTWFKGMNSSVSITQWVLYKMGELEQLQAMQANDEIKQMQAKAIEFIDRRFKQHFDDYKKNNANWKNRDVISTYELEYLLVRSLYKGIPLGEADEAAQFYTSLAEKYWAKTSNLYDRAITAIILQRNEKPKPAALILKSLREHASHKEDLGMFWANNNTSSFMTQSATSVHTFIMEAFHEVGANTKEMDEMKLWLLKQKQTQQWESVPATVSAINILLKTGTNWLESEGKINIQLGNKTIDTAQGEAGTGYFKEVFDASVITADMSTVTLSKQDAAPGWGALYWQYFEDLDKITSATTGLNVEKSLFVERITSSGKTLVSITENNPLKVGDKVIVRLTVRSDRDMEFVMLKDMRASCFEPVDQLSGVQWKQGLVYYQSPKDASTNFFFSALPKGTYVFEYPLYVRSSGEYSNGITTIQCMYAPEFTSHTAGGKVRVRVEN